MTDRKRYADDDARPSKHFRSSHIVKVLCPFYSAGAVIGEKGKKFKSLKDTTGCRIDITRQNVNFPETDERVITVQGELEGVQAVVKDIQTSIREDNIPPHVRNIDQKNNEKRKESCKLVLSDRILGALIGKGGENIDRVKDKHGVFIKIQKKNEGIQGLPERILSVSGEYEKVDECIADIISQVIDDDRHSMSANVDYASFGRDGGHRGGGGGGPPPSDHDYHRPDPYGPPPRRGGGGGGDGYYDDRAPDRRDGPLLGPRMGYDNRGYSSQRSVYAMDQPGRGAPPPSSYGGDSHRRGYLLERPEYPDERPDYGDDYRPRYGGPGGYQGGGGRDMYDRYDRRDDMRYDDRDRYDDRFPPPGRYDDRPFNSGRYDDHRGGGGAYRYDDRDRYEGRYDRGYGGGDRGYGGGNRGYDDGGYSRYS